MPVKDDFIQRMHQKRAVFEEWESFEPKELESVMVEEFAKEGQKETVSYVFNTVNTDQLTSLPMLIDCIISVGNRFNRIIDFRLGSNYVLAIFVLKAKPRIIAPK